MVLLAVAGRLLDISSSSTAEMLNQHKMPFTCFNVAVEKYLWTMFAFTKLSFPIPPINWMLQWLLVSHWCENIRPEWILVVVNQRELETKELETLDSFKVQSSEVFCPHCLFLNKVGFEYPTSSWYPYHCTCIHRMQSTNATSQNFGGKPKTITLQLITN